MQKHKKRKTCKKSKPAKAHKKTTQAPAINIEKEQHMQKEDKSQKEQNKLPLRQLLVLRTCLTSNKTNWPLKDLN